MLVRLHRLASGIRLPLREVEVLPRTLAILDENSWNHDATVLWAQSRVTDSEQVLKLLSEAKAEAFLLRQDAAELKSFTQSGAS